MKPTKELPASYVEYSAFRPQALKRAVHLLYVAPVLLFVAAFALFYQLARLLRPDFAWRVAVKPSFGLVPTLELVAALLAFFAVHEAIHAAVAWCFTREFPTIHTNLWAAQVELPGWYLPRNALLATSLAPVCLLSLAGPALLLLVPQKLLSLVVVLLAANAGGSAFDLAGSFYVSLLPASAYICNSARAGASADGPLNMPRIYVERPAQAAPDQEIRPPRKAQFRILLERLLARLE